VSLAGAETAASVTRTHAKRVVAFFAKQGEE